MKGILYSIKKLEGGPTLLSYDEILTIEIGAARKIGVVFSLPTLKANLTLKINLKNDGYLMFECEEVRVGLAVANALDQQTVELRDSLDLVSIIKDSENYQNLNEKILKVIH